MELITPFSLDGARRSKHGDPAAHLVLAAPVFLFYQVGLLVSPAAANGVDLFTRALGMLFEMSLLTYLSLMLALFVLYSLLLRTMIRRQRFNPRRFPAVLIESGLYAALMGPLAGLLLHKLHVLAVNLKQMGVLDRIVASAGAGFYEELAFRLIALSSVAWLLTRSLGRWTGICIATVAVAVLFSAAHYVGPGADAFDIAGFSFRFFLGVFLGAIYLLRGFATAVWTHALYDVWVLVILMK